MERHVWVRLCMSVSTAGSSVCIDSTYANGLAVEWIVLCKSDGLNGRKDASCALHFSFLLQFLYFLLLFSCFAFEVWKCPCCEFSITVFVVIFPHASLHWRVRGYKCRQSQRKIIAMICIFWIFSPKQQMYIIAELVLESLEENVAEHLHDSGKWCFSAVRC